MMDFLRKLRNRSLDLYHSRWLNKYSVAALLFIAWIAFFDKHNLITQWQLYSKVQHMEDTKSEYEALLVKAMIDKKDIEENKERFAREKYFMHRADEDVYIIDRD